MSINDWRVRVLQKPEGKYFTIVDEVDNIVSLKKAMEDRGRGLRLVTEYLFEGPEYACLHQEDIDRYLKRRRAKEPLTRQELDEKIESPLGLIE